MGRTIAVSTQKGGTGKTTTAAAMTQALTHKGYRVLAIDFDPQRNLTFAIGGDEDKPNIYNLLKDDIIPTEAVQCANSVNIIAGSAAMSMFASEFSYKDDQEYLLAGALEPFKNVYDFLIIDTAPVLNLSLINVLVASDDIIIPMTADIFSVQGLIDLHGTIELVKEKNTKLTIAGLLLTRFPSRTRLGKEMKETITEMASQLGTKLFKTVIRESAGIREIQVQQQNLFKLLRSRPTQDYSDFVDEYLQGRK